LQLSVGVDLEQPLRTGTSTLRIRLIAHLRRKQSVVMQPTKTGLMRGVSRPSEHPDDDAFPRRGIPGGHLSPRRPRRRSASPRPPACSCGSAGLTRSSTSCALPPEHRAWPAPVRAAGGRRFDIRAGARASGSRNLSSRSWAPSHRASWLGSSSPAPTRVANSGRPGPGASAPRNPERPTLAVPPGASPVRPSGVDRERSPA
jgi:hypothetical protein